MVLKNGLYKTSNDYQSWQDYMSGLVESYSKCSGDCNNCKKGNNEFLPKNITFVLTEACNLNCTYCYEKHKTNKKMSKEVAKQAVDFLFNKELVNDYYDVEGSQSIILEFIGGEPLLEVELMDYIVEYFKAKAFELNSPWATNYMIGITSNGVLFNDPKVQDFLDRNENKVSISITIDGDRELHDSCRVFHDGRGSYDEVVKSIDTWVKRSYAPQTKITLCPSNIQYLNKAIRNIWSLGVHGTFTNCVFEEGWTVEDAKVMYSELIELADYLLTDENYTKYYCSLFDDTIGTKLDNDDNWCGGNGQMLAIGTDGRCFPCIRFMNYSLCNSKEKPIGDIWKGIDSKKDNIWLNNLCNVTMSSQCQHEDNRKCLDCEIASGCSLCTGFNYDYYGDANHKATFICVTHKARVLANVYFWNKLYKKLNLNIKFPCNIRKEWALEIISEEEYNKLLSL